MVARSEAASYTFDVLYSGGDVAALAGGSDDPLATNLRLGDDFVYSLTADPNEFWEVIAGGSPFPLFSMRTSDSAVRTANFTLALFLDRAPQFVFSEAGIINQFVHIGTNVVTLPLGLQFDQMHLQYDLLASDNAENLPTSLLPFPAQGPETFSRATSPT